MQRVICVTGILLLCAAGGAAALEKITVQLGASAKERISCSIDAAISYQIPANILLAVAEIENGRPGQMVANRNGTHDIGTMQFNTAYLAELTPYGIRPEDVAAPGCYAYKLAAWRLRGHLDRDTGDIWTRAANYHSRTPRFNRRYRRKLILAAGRWEKWLRARIARDKAAPQSGGQRAK